MNTEISKVLSFRLSGRFAHFRKFYTNASSLSYLIPPRTVIIGMLASVLEYKRDSYYDVFTPEKFKISVSVTPGTIIRKQMQSMNYLHDSYYKVLAGGSGKSKGFHSQCKLELLIPEKELIVYTVYAGASDEDALKTLEEAESKIRRGDLGFGMYFGQRQFRAAVGELQMFENVSFAESSDHLDSLCLQENAEPDMTKNAETHIVIDQMPIQMRKEIQDKKKDKTDTGRVLHSVKRVMYEKSGKRIFGNFRNCYRIGEKTISFYEG